MAEPVETPKTSPKPKWKLEESSVWWIGYFWDPGKSSDWFGNPGTILLLSSAPFFAGAYFGYRMPAEQLEDLIQGSVGGGGGKAEESIENRAPKTTAGSSEETKKSRAATKPSGRRAPPAVDPDAIRAVAARTASKALRIATLGTVGTFGLVGALGFYASGFRSLEEAVAGTKRWASSWGKSLEVAMGGDRALSKTHPEVLATKHMDGEGELRYIYDKYIKEEVDDREDALWQNGDGNEPETKRENSPTLYAVYEKYFKKKEDS
mmetsp:Transcript_14421/g.33553  ORF Transcript_14421/g.33553 Transcript_14421/m.33553 type:complete len:264 (-) Transcript_14421:83-874(-)|eukprot:CAMPEP_0197191742 /NCGR_PEP_ID=MMETSP1423-20130617/23947_1 /TAXON_ID=476441 /ORGANISM="Pseudo-nitzschia heimii, Strain UNC1101" /LENGTH=263 /DNA_ID=CAMNT_0042644477 /DNA_START=160 /DNA_END=951 /DNA_ORIENTATION=+